MESKNFKDAKDFLIDLIINRKGYVRVKKTKEKYVSFLKKLYEFSEENQVIQKKELTIIKNAIDKLCGIYYNSSKNESKIDFEKILKKLNIQSWDYKGPLRMIHVYTIHDTKRIKEKVENSELIPEEREYYEKYFGNLDYWIEILDRIEYVRKVLNPTAKERKEKALKTIKGKVNPKIANAIDEIAENFRKSIEKTQLKNYTNSLEKFRERNGDNVSHDIYSNKKFSWGGGINHKLYKKPKSAPRYGYHDLILVGDYQQVMEDTANRDSYEIIAKFKYKMYDKIGGMISDINKGFKIEVIGNSWTQNDIMFVFDDGSGFTIRNKIVYKISHQGTTFYTYPTTFHNAYLPDGKRIKSPNEYIVKKRFNEYYKKK